MASNQILPFILKLVCGEVERRVGQTASPKGAKTEMIDAVIAAMSGNFTVTDLEKSCPGMSCDLIRNVLRQLKQAGSGVFKAGGQKRRWQKGVEKEGGVLDASACALRAPMGVRPAGA